MSKHSVLERKISFPPEAVFLSIVQDGDEVELWRVLSNQNNAVNVNRHNHAGVTALHQSVLNNNLDAVKMLLTYDADVNLADANGFTPLHTASACGLLQICSLLIIFGADLFLQTKDGDLAVDLAKDSTTTALLDAEMLRQLQQRTYFKAWLWYHFKEYSLWMLSCAVHYLRTAVQFVLRECSNYIRRKGKRTWPDNTSQRNSGAGLEKKKSSSSLSSSLSSASSSSSSSPPPASSQSSSSSSSSVLSSQLASQDNGQTNQSAANDEKRSCKKTD